LIKGREKGVYVFFKDNVCFKVGKAGTESQARWNSHHYNLYKSTPSTFTKSFLIDLPNFINYFDDEASERLSNYYQILQEKLGPLPWQFMAQEGSIHADDNDFRVSPPPRHHQRRPFHT
jgi:hypothetical protein